MLTRLAVASIVKAIKNNQNILILPFYQVPTPTILGCLVKNGFIQGYTLRGNYYIVRLKHTHYRSWGALNSSLQYARVPVRYKNKSAISAREWNKLIKLGGDAIIHIMSTDRGIKTQFSNNNSMGGIPLLKIL